MKNEDEKEEQNAFFAIPAMEHENEVNPNQTRSSDGIDSQQKKFICVFRKFIQWCKEQKLIGPGRRHRRIPFGCIEGWQGSIGLLSAIVIVILSRPLVVGQ